MTQERDLQIADHALRYRLRSSRDNISRRIGRTLAVWLVAVFAVVLAGSRVQAADKVLTMTTTSTVTTLNPYGESEAQAFFIWCQVYGCLGRIDYITKQLKGELAQNWEIINPTTWRYKLRTDLKRQDGGPGPTSEDVVHSWKRLMNDPESAQRWIMLGIKEIVAVDSSTFDIITDTPTVEVNTSLFGQFIITSKELFEKYGPEAYRSRRSGWGPYKLENFEVDQRIVLRKSDVWPEKAPAAPDVVIYRQMREAEQRVTAVLNDEVQVARLIPPQLVDRFKGQSRVKIAEMDSLEIMFMTFNATMPPWNDRRVRQAAAHAINRDLIIQRLLFGYARRLDGALGPTQICYDGPSKETLGFDIEKAKALLAEAGYANGGPDILFYTPSGRYISDKQISEAIVQMLQRVGFRVKLVAPEWANMWSDVRGGKTPAYYMGRGTFADPSLGLSQYFETGVTPRTMYSNPEIDQLFAKIRTTADDSQRCRLVRETVDKITADAAAQFLWTHKIIHAVRSDIEWPLDPSGDAWYLNIKMK
jgi:peptide/nickel transport system substrate-binding protein